MSEPRFDGEGAVDLDAWTPAGTATVDYAIELLRSTHKAETRGAERWLLDHPDVAGPRLVAALETESAQAVAMLLGLIGGSEAVAPLLDAYGRGGEGLRSAARRGLTAMAERGVADARDALNQLDRRGST